MYRSIKNLTQIMMKKRYRRTIFFHHQPNGLMPPEQKTPAVSKTPPVVLGQPDVYVVEKVLGSRV